MIINFNKNISYLSEKIRKDVIRVFNLGFSTESKCLIIKSIIIQIVYRLTGQHIFESICDIDLYMDHDGFNFNLLIYDMDKRTVDILYYYDFEYIQKIKDRKLKIQEILSDDRSACELD